MRTFPPKQCRKCKAVKPRTVEYFDRKASDPNAFLLICKKCREKVVTGGSDKQLSQLADRFRPEQSA